MTVIAGLPAHVLFVHAIVVLAPLTALLEILCGVWPAARRRLIWLVVGLAVVTTVLTPLTTEAGQWLYDREQRHSAIQQTHAERGDWMIYFSIALFAVAVALVVLHWLEERSHNRRLIANIVVAAVALAVGISSIVMVIEIGDSGAQAVWHNKLTRADNG
jgi:uncharacterized membrane protein YoaK (UPF0700 family)